MSRRSARLNPGANQNDEQPDLPQVDQPPVSNSRNGRGRGRAGRAPGTRAEANLAGQPQPVPRAHGDQRQGPTPARGRQGTRGTARGRGGRRATQTRRQPSPQGITIEQAPEEHEEEQGLHGGLAEDPPASTVSDFHRLVETARTNAQVPALPANGQELLAQAFPALGTLTAVQGVSTNRKRPAIIEGFESTGIQILAPTAIERKVKEGWVEHIGLQYLTDAFCLNLVAHASLSAANSSRDILEPPAETEKNLSMAEWTQAYKRLLSLLQAHQPGLYEPWKAHYENIISREGLSLEWNSWLAYDIQVRFTALRTGIDPRVFHHEIWERERRSAEADVVKQAIASEIRAGLAHAIDSRLDFRLRDAPAAPPTVSPLKRARGSTDKDDLTFFRSYKRRQFTPQAEASTANPNFLSQPPSQRWPRCFICSNPASIHGEWFRCDQKTTKEGRPVLLVRDKQGRFVHTTDGRRICYEFNRKFSGCQDSSCTKGEHSCSLCGSTAHGAQRCQ